MIYNNEGVNLAMLYLIAKIENQNILQAELNAILIAIKTIQNTQTDTHIFIDSLKAYI
jgi:hypothetical protein